MNSDNRFETINRSRSIELDKILGRPFPVLDDGFIRVIDYMGTDSSIVQAARVSYGKGTKKTSADRGLIRYLLRNQHTSPFEMCELKLHIRVPMDCWRQWIRHRTASVNEYSTRYSLAQDSYLATSPDAWRQQAVNNKQGSSGLLPLSEGTRFTEREGQLHSLCKEIYTERVDAGIAREQARKDIPLGTYTEAYWKIDLHNLLHFLRLRMDSHAQLEIRSYATLIGEEIVSRWCPLVWAAFLDYRVSGLSLSQPEIKLLQLLNRGAIYEAQSHAREIGFLIQSKKNGDIRPGTECVEFNEKLEKMGIPVSASWMTPSN